MRNVKTGQIWRFENVLHSVFSIARDVLQTWPKILKYLAVFIVAVWIIVPMFVDREGQYYGYHILFPVLVSIPTTIVVVWVNWRTKESGQTFHDMRDADFLPVAFDETR